MIRVFKHPEPPASLLRQGNAEYNHQDVQSQLLADQNSKCYLCERICVTDYQIEHLQSVDHHGEKKCDWNNLFLACSYCNGKKQNNYDDILNPSVCEVENLIECHHQASTKSAQFSPIGDVTPEISLTIELLHKVFNGTGSIRKIKEERFYEYFLQRINHFLFLVADYLKAKTDENKIAIEEELHISKEFLGFKYHIIRSNANLTDDFRQLLIWNKQ